MALMLCVQALCTHLCSVCTFLTMCINICVSSNENVSIKRRKKIKTNEVKEERQSLERDKGKIYVMNTLFGNERKGENTHKTRLVLSVQKSSSMFLYGECV